MAKIKQPSKKKSSILKVSQSPYIKVAISMPSNDLSRIENVCKQLKLSRSGFMVLAIHHWFETQKKQSLVEQYVRGYESMPEDVVMGKALTALQSQILHEENW